MKLLDPIVHLMSHQLMDQGEDPGVLFSLLVTKAPKRIRAALPGPVVVALHVTSVLYRLAELILTY